MKRTREGSVIAGVGVAKSRGALGRTARSTHYDVLGVASNADEETIRTAFRKAAKSHHPDLNLGDPTAGLQFQQVVAAYELLKNSEQREAYDQQLKVERRARRLRLVSSIVSGMVSGAMVAMALWLLYVQSELSQSPLITTAAVSQPETPAAGGGGGGGGQNNGSGRTQENDASKDTGAGKDTGVRKGIAAAIPPDRPLPDGQPQPPPSSVDTPTNDQPDARAPLTAEWEGVQADGDPMAIWDFAVRHPGTPESVMARSKTLMLIETTRDLFFLNVLQIGATDAIANLARQRLTSLGALTAADEKKKGARDPPAGTGNSIEQRATSFVTAQISAWSSTNPRQLAALTTTYADEVFFNGTLKSRLAVMNEKHRLQGQFPDRVYEALPNSFTTECVANACRVAGAMDWKTRGGAHPSAPRERLRFEYGVLFAQDAFSVISENTREAKGDGQAEDTDPPPRLPPRRLPVPRPTAAKGKSAPPHASQIDRSPRENTVDITEPY